MLRRLYYGLPGVFLAVWLASPLLVEAAPSISGQSDSPINQKDIYYDYQVWRTLTVTRYVVVAEFLDGHVEENEFLTEANAQAFVAWLYFHVADLKNAYVEPRTKMVKVLVGTYDTLAEAEDVADSYRGPTEIVPVRAFGTRVQSSSRS